MKRERLNKKQQQRVPYLPFSKSRKLKRCIKHSAVDEYIVEDVTVGQLTAIESTIMQKSQ